MSSPSLIAMFREEELRNRSCSSGECPVVNISQAERWMSMGIGGALVLAGISRGRLGGLLTTVLGGTLVYRGVTGHCYAYESMGMDTSEHGPATAIPAQQGVKIEKSISIRKPADELFAFWRNFENLPRIMEHLKSVTVHDSNRSHWVADAVAGKTVAWDAEVINERPGELIAWKSIGGEVDTAGSVHFTPGRGDRGTVVTVSLKYNPPGGKVAASVIEWMGLGAERMISEGLRRFKQLMEAGEVASTQGQSQGIGSTIQTDPEF